MGLNPVADSAIRGRLRRVTSKQNSLVKELRQAFQRSELTTDGYCAVEGQHLAEEAIRSGLRIKAVFFSDEAGSRIEKLLPQISSQAEALILPDDVFRSAVNTEDSPGRGRAGEMARPQTGADPGTRKPASGRRCRRAGPGKSGDHHSFRRGVWCYRRTAWREDGQRVQLQGRARLRGIRVPGAAHPYGPRTIEELRGHGVRFLATSSHKGTPIDEADLSGGVALMIGSEGAGLPRDYMARVDETVRIPQSERVESLNAGIAASILLYEAARQRRSASELP